MKNAANKDKTSRGPRMYFRLTPNELGRVQNLAAATGLSPAEFVKAVVMRDATPFTSEYEHVIALMVDLLKEFKSLSEKVDAGSAQVAKLGQGVEAAQVQAKQAVGNQVIMDQKADKAAKRVEDAIDRLEILVASAIPGGMNFRETIRGNR